jgi:high-affinity K+ transport system ATPase subunit B
LLYQTGIVAGSEATSADRTGEKTLGERDSTNVMTVNASGEGEYDSETVTADCRDDEAEGRSSSVMTVIALAIW